MTAAEASTNAATVPRHEPERGVIGQIVHRVPAAEPSLHLFNSQAAKEYARLKPVGCLRVCQTGLVGAVRFELTPRLPGSWGTLFLTGTGEASRT